MACLKEEKNKYSCITDKCFSEQTLLRTRYMYTVTYTIMLQYSQFSVYCLIDTLETKHEYTKNLRKNPFEIKTSQQKQRMTFSFNHSTNVNIKDSYKHNISAK